MPRLFTIRGTLRYAEHETPAEMVRVDLKRFTGEVVLSAFTRASGEFEFPGVPSGTYFLVVEKEGYEPIRESVELFVSSRLGIFLYLRKPLGADITPRGEVVSTRELRIPEKARREYQKGIERFYDKKDARGGIGHFQRALNFFPTYFEAYYHIGIAYMELGQTAAAEQALRKSIELSEHRFADPQFALGAILCDSQRFTEAESFLRTALRLNGTAWQGYFELARALLGLNRLEEAEKSIQEARMRKPDFATIHLVSANIHIRKQNYPELIKDLDEFLRLDPAGPQSGDVRQMRETVQRALGTAPDPLAPGQHKP